MVVGNSHPHSVAHVGGWLAALGTGRADSHLSARMIGILGPAAPWPPALSGRSPLASLLHCASRRAMRAAD